MSYSEYLIFGRVVRSAEVTESLLEPMRLSGFSEDALATARARLAAEDEQLAAVLSYEAGAVEGALPAVADLAQVREVVRARGPNRSAIVTPSEPGRI